MTDTVAVPPLRWMTLRKLLALLFALAIFFAWIYGPSESEILSHQSRWKQAVDEDPWLWGGVFVAVEIVVISLSMPAAGGMMILCGFLFGRWRGVLIISAGAPIGAVLAMLVSRYLLRNITRRALARRPRFAGWVESADRGIERDGWYYLLLLRLTPVIPFFLINVAMGLTRIRPFTFWWVTFLGMLPATFVFVHAGATASEIRKFSDLVSFDTVLALMLIVMLPIVLRLVVPRAREL